MNPRSLFTARAEGKAALLLAAGLALCPAAAARAPQEEPEETPLRALVDLPDLYTMTGQSDVAVLATVQEIARYTTFTVEEVFAGNYREPELRLIYRGMSWERRLDGEGGIRFRPGERYLLFLRYHSEHEQVVAPDLFGLMDGTWGRLQMEGEGEGLYVEAMRLLMGAASRPQISQRHAVLVGLLGSDNHLAAAAAMTQVYERRLGSVDTIPTLLGQMDRGIAGLRLGALRILRRLGPTLPHNLNRASLAEAIQLRVSWDDSDLVAVRTEAVAALAALGQDAVSILEQVARADTDQSVRYEAAVAALRLKG